VATIVLALFTLSAPADEIRTLQAVGDHAQGAAEARQAREALVSGGAKNLLPLLSAFKGSTPLACNWLRSTFESIADREIKAGRELPRQPLLEFVGNTGESPVARRLAYEWLLESQPQLADQLIPTMLLDPSPEFRRDAVERLIEEAKQAGGAAATPLYQQALLGAVHEDQVKTIAAALREAGLTVDLQRHFGFLADWQVIGPFDNKDMRGFAVAYPPEQQIDLAAHYDGQLGPVRWQPIDTSDDYGVIDIGKTLDNFKGSLMYAATTYDSDQQRQVEFRLGTPNAWKLWVNGQLVFEREEYHRGTRMDQYKIPVTLPPGRNTILLKVCQNEQTQPWAQDYLFQLRVCDSTGTAVLSAAAADRSDNLPGVQ
jgi:hypothetical protein